MTYKVTVTREGDAWLADVPDVPGAHTFARTLAGLAKSVREVVVLMDDLPDDADPELRFTFPADDAALARASEVGELRRDFQLKEAEVQTKTRQAAREMIAAGYSVRDAALVLRITPGRVSQLTHA